VNRFARLGGWRPCGDVSCRPARSCRRKETAPSPGGQPVHARFRVVNRMTKNPANPFSRRFRRAAIVPRTAGDS